MVWLEFVAILLLIYAFIMFVVFIFQARLFFSPIYYRDEEALLEIQEFLTPLNLVSEDGTLLEGIIYEPYEEDDASDTQKIILYFGGVQQDSVALVNKFASHYPHMPFITYNYRGYGKSEGRPSQDKLFVDAMHIYDDLIIRYHYKPENIILMGYSLGSGVASFLGSQRQVKEILLMAPYDSVYEVLKKRYPFSGIHWILKQKFPSIDFVPRIDVPVHIYAASDDKVVNIKHAKMLKNYVNNLAGFYEYGNVGHNDILFNPDVVEHIKEILNNFDEEKQMSKEAIILLNMGGPNDLSEVEMFLTNMFNDPNILTMKSGGLRKFVATMITFFRTESSQEIYRELGGKSPIVGHTEKLVSALQEALPEIYIDYVMRYTPPFAPEVIDKLKDKGIEKIYLIPLYPQYSTTTTKSSLEDFEKAFNASGLDAILVEKKHYYELSKYNDAVIDRVVEGLEGDKSEDYHLIFSAHGLPQKIVDAGDPYQRHVERHVELLKQKLEDKGIQFKHVALAYQSKVGPMAWLEPSLETMLDKTRNENVLIYPIAFTIDNSETDFELGIEYKEIADELGFKKFKVAPCVNDHPLFIEALVELYEKMKFD